MQGPLSDFLSMKSHCYYSTRYSVTVKLQKTNVLADNYPSGHLHSLQYMHTLDSTYFSGTHLREKQGFLRTHFTFNHLMIIILLPILLHLS